MLRTNPLLIQVVPQLKPQRCGITDHAIPLALELQTAFGIDTAFVVLNSDERCDVPFRVIHCAPAQLTEACDSLREGQPAALLVHLSGYGYSRDGAPTLLADALARLRTHDQFKIAVYFHELFAVGKPWRSAFWYSLRQQIAVRRIAMLCDLLVTNTSHHANWLARQRAAPIHLLPVFSTVGETQLPIPTTERQPAMAVFGLAASRQRAYDKLAPMAGRLDQLGIREIIDIGAETDVPSSLNGIPVRRRGLLGASEIRDEFSRAKFGFLPHAAKYLAKSSIFAAYCAQGTIPVTATPFDGEVDGLKDGVHFISPQTVDSAQTAGLDHCSRAAWQWYSEHRIHAHAATYARWLSEVSDAGAR